MAEAADEETRLALRSPQISQVIAAAAVTPQLDFKARALAPTTLAVLARSVVEAARSSDPTQALNVLTGGSTR
jgi:hypothetical protein